MTRRIAVALALTLFGNACGSNDAGAAPATVSASAGQDVARPATFTEADLDGFERGLGQEIAAIKAAQNKANSATTPEERGQAMQAQWEGATIPLGAKASSPTSKGIPFGILSLRDFRRSTRPPKWSR